MLFKFFFFRFIYFWVVVHFYIIQPFQVVGHQKNHVYFVTYVHNYVCLCLATSMMYWSFFFFLVCVSFLEIFYFFFFANSCKHGLLHVHNFCWVYCKYVSTYKGMYVTVYSAWEKNVCLCNTYILTLFVVVVVLVVVITCFLCRYININYYSAKIRWYALAKKYL